MTLVKGINGALKVIYIFILVYSFLNYVDETPRLQLRTTLPRLSSLFS